MKKLIRQLMLLLGLLSCMLMVQVLLSGVILYRLKERPVEGAALKGAVSQPSDGAAAASMAMPPDAVVPQATVSNAYVRGDADAPVTIIEFSDFQCPYCTRSAPMLQEVMHNYQGKVKLAYRHFPLAMHANAYGAALAAEAAGEQGKFWEMHDLLFEQMQDAADAQRYGVAGTPTFFVNGRKVVGALPYADFTRILDEELAKVKR